MKKLIFSFFAFLLIANIAVSQDIPAAKAGQQYGKAITKDGAIKTKDLAGKIEGDKAFNGKIEGVVVEVCAKKGCFIKIQREGEGDPIMVRFTDYGYFMPQDIVGKTIVLEGQAKMKETSVAWLKHYAEDAGKSAEEIAKITQPKVDINIVADGVVVVK